MRVRNILIITAILSSALAAVVVYLVLTVPNDVQAAALLQKAQLVLGHRALQSEQQPVVRLPRLVDAIRVDEQRSDQSAQVDEVVPIPAIAGEAKPGG